VKLDAIAEQPRAVEQLSRALEGGRVAHAYAFVGPAGAGRFTTALAFASELLGADATRGQRNHRPALALRHDHDVGRGVQVPVNRAQ